MRLGGKPSAVAQSTTNARPRVRDSRCAGNVIVAMGYISPYVTVVVKATTTYAPPQAEATVGERDSNAPCTVANTLKTVVKRLILNNSCNIGDSAAKTISPFCFWHCLAANTSTRKPALLI